jgi:rubredoxin
MAGKSNKNKMSEEKYEEKPERFFCKLCRSSNAKILFRSKEYHDGYAANVMRCRQCGLV